MKNAKKLLGLLLALAMVFALAVPAFAADPTPPVYEIYQIFTGDYADGILSNVKWGQNAKRPTGTNVGDKVDKTVLNGLEAVTSATSDTAKLAVINQYFDPDTTPLTKTASGPVAGKYQFTGLDNGYYLVKTKDGTADGEGQFYTLYVVQVVDGTLEFVPKGSAPTTEKKIVDGGKASVNEASIGDTVSYEITGTLPTRIADYNEYYYVFTDTLSAGLTCDEASITVTVDGEDATAYFYKNVTGTTITVGIENLLALNNVSGDKFNITEDSQVVITYSAKLNENAVAAGTGNKNDVTLTYSNDPNHSGDGTTTPPTTPPPTTPPEPEHPTGVTPKSEVTTYTTELTILKTDDEGQALPGAEFTLTGGGVNVIVVKTESFAEDASGTYWKLADGTYTTTAPNVTGIPDDPDDNSADYASTTTKYTRTEATEVKGNSSTPPTSVVGTVDEGGHVTFTGLGAGSYTLTETKTPAGYNTAEPITFTLTFDPDTQAFASNNTKVVVGTDNKLDVTIINEPGVTLPTTGGMGTTLFYLIGGLLAAGAVVLLVTKRRMDSHN